MKKVLLMLVTFVAAINVSAEEWKEGTFTPVNDASKLGGLKTVVTSDGDVYASSTYNQQFTFAGANIKAPIGVSACIVKYDKNADEKWAVALVGGSAKVRTMAVDADGTLYAAGTFEDLQLDCYGTNNAEAVTISGDEAGMAKTAFIVKITKEGVVSAAKAINPSAPKFPEGYADESMIDYGVVPNKISVDGDKVYVSATYQGDVTELGWQGSYLDYGIIEMFTYAGNRSDGVFSLNKSDLNAPTSILTVQHTGRLITPYIDIQSRCDAFSILTYGGKVYATFIGSGNLTMTTPTASKNLEFAVTDYENEIKEHGMVFVDPADVANPIIYHATANGLYYDPDCISIMGEVQNDKIYLAGTFIGEFPLDETVSKTTNTAFAASLKPSNAEKLWTWINDKEEESCGRGLVVTGEEVTVCTNANLYQLKSSDGTFKKALNMIVADGAQADDKYVAVILGDEEGKVHLMIQEMNPSAINETKTLKNGAAKIYNLNGVELSAPQKGLNIIKTTDGVKKVTVK